MRIRCPICLMELIFDEETLITDCRHVFHNACLTRWLRKSATCPKCRHPIKPNGVMTLYLEVYADAPRTITAEGLDMEGIDALEKCAELLMEKGGKNGIMSIKELGKNMSVMRHELEVLLEAYPGFFAQYDIPEAVAAEHGAKRRKLDVSTNPAGDRRVVELCPQFMFCWAYAGRKGCVESKCRKLHVCRKFVLDNEDGCKNGLYCRFGHSYVSGHNLRLVRKEFECDARTIPDVLIAKIISFSLAKHARAASGSSKTREGAGAHEEETGGKSKAEEAQKGGADGGRGKSKSAPRAKVAPRTRANRAANS